MRFKVRVTFFMIQVICVAISLLLISCPDTTIPQLSFGGGRVCSIDELDAFREVSNLNEREELWIAFVDVGQGDATWIRTPGTRDLDAKDIVVDSGNCRVSDGSCGFSSQVNDSFDSDGVGALIGFMQENGWVSDSPIDYLVATHPDKDHYGGTWKLLQNYRVGAFISSGFPSDNKTYQTALGAVRAEPGIVDLTPVSIKGLNMDQEGEFKTESWGRNFTVQLLSADLSSSEDNNSSVVLMIEYLGVRILLTGDAEEPLDERLIRLDDATTDDLLRANILKAGHHGGRGTNSQALLNRIFPTPGRHFAIVSSGLRDGLPHPDTMARLESHIGTQGIYRTDRGDFRPAKDMANAAGDDHILVRVSAEGDFTICYAYSD